MDINKETILDLSKMNRYAQRANLGELLLQLISSGGGGGSGTGDTSLVQKDTYLQFPSVGNENNLYIDKSQNTIYRWDSKGLKYYMVGINLESAINAFISELSFVDGGNADN